MGPPLLLIDVGNTRLKWFTALGESDFATTLLFSSTITSVRTDPKGKKSVVGKKPVGTEWGEMETSQATAARIQALAGKFPEHRVVLSSVVPKLVPHFHRAFRGRIHQVTADSSALGLSFVYPTPSEIGADRLVAAAAIREDRIGPAIIVQCGTATAFTVLNAQGQFCGGVIAPGPQAQLAGLLGSTAQLPAMALSPPAPRSPEALLGRKARRAGTILGHSTREAIRLGILLSFPGGVNAILRRLTREISLRSGSDQPHIILTGGNAEHLTGSLEFPYTLRPLLVFEGLRIIGKRAFPAS